MNLVTPPPFQLNYQLCSVCVQARLEQISELWQKLIETSSTKRQTLIDDQKRGQFVREVDEVAAWISDREAVASAEDVGKDLEHVEMLQKIFADFLKVKYSLNMCIRIQCIIHWLYCGMYVYIISARTGYSS